MTRKGFGELGMLWGNLWSTVLEPSLRTCIIVAHAWMMKSVLEAEISWNGMGWAGMDRRERRSKHWQVASWELGGLRGELCDL